MNMLEETQPGSGYFYVKDPLNPHLGGNIRNGDPNSYTPELWSWLVAQFGIYRVLDVGCGEGHAVKYFRDNKIYATGIDGLKENARNSITPIIVHDLSSGPYLSEKFDLALCCEVADHIAPNSVENLLKTLCRARVVAMTHALPGQHGHHHVNLQPAEYWIKHFHSHGFKYIERESSIARSLSKSQVAGWEAHFARSGLIFIRKSPLLRLTHRLFYK